LWHTGNDPPPGDDASPPLDVAVGSEAPVVDIVAPGFGFRVVDAPAMMVRVGVFVATGSQ